jgi:hypothetical protein
MNTASDPEISPSVSPMMVTIPVRNFVGMGIPHSGISFGDTVGEIVYTMSISFVGTNAQGPTADLVLPPGDSPVTTPSSNPLNTITAQYWYYPNLYQAGTGYNAVDQQVYNLPGDLLGLPFVATGTP